MALEGYEKSTRIALEWAFEVHGECTRWVFEAYQEGSHIGIRSVLEGYEKGIGRMFELHKKGIGRALGRALGGHWKCTRRILEID